MFFVSLSGASEITVYRIGSTLGTELPVSQSNGSQTVKQQRKKRNMKTDHLVNVALFRPFSRLSAGRFACMRPLAQCPSATHVNAGLKLYSALIHTGSYGTLCNETCSEGASATAEETNHSLSFDSIIPGLEQ